VDRRVSPNRDSDSGAAMRTATDPAIPLVVFVVLAAIGASQGMGWLTWLFAAAIAGYSLSGSV
jgi:hypothetical protein